MTLKIEKNILPSIDRPGKLSEESMWETWQAVAFGFSSDDEK